jgi:hypothetical protein
MQGRLWHQARDALAAVAEASPKFDADGVDLYFLNSNRFEKNIKVRDRSPSSVISFWYPSKCFIRFRPGKASFGSSTKSSQMVRCFGFTTWIHILSSHKKSGGTPTGARLQQVLNEYIPKIENKPSAHVKPVNIIVITDGDPSKCYLDLELSDLPHSAL